MESGPTSLTKAMPIATLLRQLYLAAYLAALLLLFGVLPPLAGGLPGSELAFGTLIDPELSARTGLLAALFGAAALLIAAPLTVLGRVALMLLVAGFLAVLGPHLIHVPAGLTMRCAWGALLLIPLLFRRVKAARSEVALLPALATGMGVGIGLYVLLGRLHHFGYGEAYEAHARVIVLLLIAAIGGLAFALPLLGGRKPLIPDPPAEDADTEPPLKHAAELRAQTTAAIGGAFATFGAPLGLLMLADLTTNFGLDQYLRRFGLDLSELGRWEGTGLLAAGCLIGVGFGLGIALAAWPSRKHVAAFVVGLGTARWLIPELFERAALEPIPVGTPDMVMPPLLNTALYLAAGGALVAAWSAVRNGRQLGVAALLVFAAAIPALTPHSPVATDAIANAPWRRFEAQPPLVIDSPLGLIAVEQHPSGETLLVVDGLTMTPPPADIPDDNLALRTALDLVEANWQPGDPNPRVLLLGQLTQARLDTFWEWKAATGREASLLWSVPWEAELARIEALLPGMWPQPPVAFAQARANIGRGEYDLVIVPEALGREIVALTALQPARAGGGRIGLPWRDTGRDQPVVAWLSTTSGLGAAHIGKRVVLAGADLEAIGLGIVHGLEHVPAGLTVDAGVETAPPYLWTSLSQRTEVRLSAQRAALFERLARDADDAFLAALAVLMDKQKESSPWVEPRARFELERVDVVALADATHTPLRPFERLIWEQLAEVMVEKRMPGEAFATLPGLLEAHGRWPVLEYALARTYLEMLMPDAAVELLGPLFAEGELARRGVVALVEYGDALGQLDRYGDALAVFEAARALVPGERQIARRIATYGVRAGRAGAVEAVQALLDADPDDTELQLFLGMGPYPAPEAGFDPAPLDDGHDH